MSYLITSDGLKESLDWLEKFPDITRKAARMALNQVTEREALPHFRRSIMDEINFPPGYLKADSRLAVSKKATDASLSTAITARDRATSLARFVKGNTSRRGGLVVSVKRGKTTHMRRAFIINLNNGNQGLAIRLSEGERLIGRYKQAKPLGGDSNVYLLYGPSVEQAFKMLIPSSTARITDALSREFLRQFTRLNRA